MNKYTLLSALAIASVTSKKLAPSAVVQEGWVDLTDGQYSCLLPTWDADGVATWDSYYADATTALITAVEGTDYLWDFTIAYGEYGYCDYNT